MYRSNWRKGEASAVPYGVPVSDLLDADGSAISCEVGLAHVPFQMQVRDRVAHLSGERN